MSNKITHYLIDCNDYYDQWFLFIQKKKKKKKFIYNDSGGKENGSVNRIGNQSGKKDYKGKYI